MLGLILLGAGCAPAADDVIPVYQGDEDSFIDIFEVCQDPASGERIYVNSFFGDDSGWATYYDQDGVVIEKTPEFGPGSLSEYTVQTEVENCTRTTEEYFATKVK